jgi:arabinofuranosyltransferase
MSARDEPEAAALLVFLGLFAVVLLRTAWVCDDAYITLRVVDNAVNGLGLRWNAVERVQTYTHPLWMLVLTPFYFLTREAFYTVLALSFACSLAAVFVVAFRIATSVRLAALAVLALAFSKAFADYSTSGLENPLTHLILAAFAYELFAGAEGEGSFLRLAALAGLGTLNRMDTLLLFLPALALRLLSLPWRRGLGLLALGFAPFLAWEAFAVFYYGFPFPNTAYAKLNTGIPSADLARQGLCYLLNSLASDPLTLAIVFAGILAALVARDRRALALAAGALLTLVYVVRIGGDFMSGRLLAAPFLVCVILLARSRLALSGPGFAVSALFVAALGLAAPYPNLLAGSDYGIDRRGQFMDGKGITDERARYYQGMGLLRARRGLSLPDYPWRTEGEEARFAGDAVVTREAVGLFGFFAGPRVHVLDVCALGEPLLARLPAEAGWRIGHFNRRVPPGLEESLRQGTILIDDPALATYYMKLRRVTRGPLFSGKRLAAIWDLNLGSARHLLDGYFALHSRMRRVSIEEVSGRGAGGVATGDSEPAPLVLSSHGAEVALGGLRREPALDVSLDGSDAYRLRYVREGWLVAEQDVGRCEGRGLCRHLLETPERAATLGFDAIQVLPVQGDERYCLGHLRFVKR